MQELFDLIFDVISIPTGMEYLKPLIFVFMLGFGTILSFSLFKVFIEKI